MGGGGGGEHFLVLLPLRKSPVGTHGCNVHVVSLYVAPGVRRLTNLR